MSSVLDLIRKKKDEIAAQKASQTPVIRPAPGKHRYRVLPGWRGNGDKQFFHDFGLHYVKVPDQTGKLVLETVYVCTEKTFGASDCQICDAVSQGMRATRDDGVVAILKEARSSQKYLMNVLHLTGDKPTKPQLMEVGPKVFQQICEIIEEHDDITDLDGGKDLIITRNGSGLDTTYTVVVAANSKPVPASVMQDIINIDAVVSQESPAGLHKALTSVMKAQGRKLPPAAAPAIAASAAPALASSASAVDDEEDVPWDTASVSSSDDDLEDLLREIS